MPNNTNNTNTLIPYKVTALAPEAQNFDLMYEQVKALKSGQSVDKPIYNHVTGLLDPAEKTDSPKIPVTRRMKVLLLFVVVMVVVRW